MKNKKNIAFLLIFVMILFICACGKKDNKTDNIPKDIGEIATVINADYPYYENASDIVNASDLVFSGTVKNIRYELLGPPIVKEDANLSSGEDESSFLPYTIFMIEVKDIYKGTIYNEYIEIKMLGGSQDSNIIVGGDKLDLVIDQEYVILATLFEDSYPSFVNIIQSTYPINDEQTDKLEVNNNNPITLSQILEIVN